MGINVRTNQSKEHAPSQGTVPWQTKNLSLAVTAGQGHFVMLLWVTVSD